MIHYNILDHSTTYYEKLGFERVEVPWMVTREVSDITRPEGAREYQLVHDNNKVLVASAEQSFLYQYIKGFLPKGRFQAITPCYRFENFDATHSKYFMKNELIDTKNVTTACLGAIVDLAYLFFVEYLPEDRLKIITTGTNSFDIMFRFPETSDQIELGSYGIRHTSVMSYVYGTGVAEPRLSKVIDRYAWLPKQ